MLPSLQHWTVPLPICTLPLHQPWSDCPSNAVWMSRFPSSCLSLSHTPSSPTDPIHHLILILLRLLLALVLFLLLDHHNNPPPQPSNPLSLSPSSSLPPLPPSPLPSPFFSVFPFVPPPTPPPLPSPPPVLPNPPGCTDICPSLAKNALNNRSNFTDLAMSEAHI